MYVHIELNKHMYRCHSPFHSIEYFWKNKIGSSDNHLLQSSAGNQSAVCSFDSTWLILLPYYQFVSGAYRVIQSDCWESINKRDGQGGWDSNQQSATSILGARAQMLLRQMIRVKIELRKCHFCIVLCSAYKTHMTNLKCEKTGGKRAQHKVRTRLFLPSQSLR